VFGIDPEADEIWRKQDRANRLGQIRETNRIERQALRDHEELITGLRDGDLLPLAQHLRSGKPIPQFISDEIAAMIEQLGTHFNIVAIGKNRGQIKWSLDLLTERRHAEIGVHAEMLARRYGKRQVKIAIGETMDIFEVSESLVHACRNELKKKLARIPEKYREQAWADWLAAYSRPSA
jgi:hypothetical protein